MTDCKTEGRIEEIERLIREGEGNLEALKKRLTELRARFNTEIKGFAFPENTGTLHIDMGAGSGYPDTIFAEVGGKIIHTYKRV